MGKALETLRQFSNSPHLAPLFAEWRRGLKDAQDVVLNAFPDSHKSRDEPNTVGNPTQYIATQERLGRDLEPDRQEPPLAQSQRQREQDLDR
jgi:hypothetical protein